MKIPGFGSGPEVLRRFVDRPVTYPDASFAKRYDLRAREKYVARDRITELMVPPARIERAASPRPAAKADISAPDARFQNFNLAGVMDVLGDLGKMAHFKPLRAGRAFLEVIGPT